MTFEEKKCIIKQLFDPQKASGVTDREIFALGFQTKAEFEKYLLSAFYGVSKYSELGHFKSSFTKRSIRVWAILRDAMKRIRSEDYFGLYTLTRRFHYDILAYVTAVNTEEATLLGNMMFGYLIPKHSTLEATFHEFGSENSIRKNQDLLNDINSKLKRRDSSITAIQRDRDSLLDHKKTLQIIIDQLKEQK